MRIEINHCTHLVIYRRDSIILTTMYNTYELKSMAAIPAALNSLKL